MSMQHFTHPSTRLKKLQKKIRKQVSHAISDFDMIQDGDRIMVCLSGGKDSYTLLDMLLMLQRIAPINFEVVAVNLDQKQPGFDESILPDYLSQLDIEYYILEKDTYQIVKEKIPEGQTYCSLCSRLRRGSLYGFAEQIQANKIALGHHRDDLLATFMLNMFHGGRLKSMPPKLLSDDKKHMVIRPLAYVAEADIIKYARYREFPIIPCNLCGSQTNLQRAQINEMLREWDDAHPKRLQSMFAALQNVTPSHLADNRLFDFEHLEQEQACANPESATSTVYQQDSMSSGFVKTEIGFISQDNDAALLPSQVRYYNPNKHRMDDAVLSTASSHSAQLSTKSFESVSQRIDSVTVTE